jgi:hypothetical protein
VTTSHHAPAPPETPYGRVVDALAIIAQHYGQPGPSRALRNAGAEWRDEVLAQLAEAVAALLIEVRPQATRSERPGRQ